MIVYNRICLYLFAWLVLPLIASSQGSDLLDPNLPEYEPVQGVSGSIKAVGSDTMNNMMALWAEGFKEFYPNVSVEIEGKGSSTAPPALISGAANFGPMSREMKGKEIDAFVEKYGYEPTPLAVGLDVLALYVNNDNPIERITMAQADAIFSKTRRRGLDTNITTWGDLGLTGNWAQQPVSIYGRNAASGTYGFFKDNVMLGGDFKDSVKEQPGSSSVVQAVASDPYSIGYSGIGYKTADVRAVPIEQDGVEVAPDAEHAYAGEYPLTRFLLVYTNYKPGSDLDPLRREFIRFIFSRPGQEQVIKDGYYPLSAELAQRSLSRVGIEVEEPQP